MARFKPGGSSGSAPTSSPSMPTVLLAGQKFTLAVDENGNAYQYLAALQIDVNGGQVDSLGGVLVEVN